MSLTLPPVRLNVVGMPPPSVITWCLEPGRARSTGLGPLLGRAAPPAQASCRSSLATVQLPGRVQLGQKRLVQPLAPRPRSTPPGAASTSSRTRTPAPGAETPTASRYAVRTGCPARPAGPAAACGPAWAARGEPVADAPVHQQPICGGRMTGDCYVRACESGSVRFPPAAHQNRLHGLMRRGLETERYATAPVPDPTERRSSSRAAPITS